jgi:hypothetical protein
LARVSARVACVAVEAAELGICCNDVVGEGDFEKEAMDNFATCAGSKIRANVRSWHSTPPASRIVTATQAARRLEAPQHR